MKCKFCGHSDSQHYWNRKKKEYACEYHKGKERCPCNKKNFIRQQGIAYFGEFKAKNENEKVK